MRIAKLVSVEFMRRLAPSVHTEVRARKAATIPTNHLFTTQKTNTIRHTSCCTTNRATNRTTSTVLTEDRRAADAVDSYLTVARSLCSWPRRTETRAIREVRLRVGFFISWPLYAKESRVGALAAEVGLTQIGAERRYGVCGSKDEGRTRPASRLDGAAWTEKTKERGREASDVGMVKPAGAVVTAFLHALSESRPPGRHGDGRPLSAAVSCRRAPLACALWAGGCLPRAPARLEGFVNDVGGAA